MNGLICAKACSRHRKGGDCSHEMKSRVLCGGGTQNHHQDCIQTISSAWQTIWPTPRQITCNKKFKQGKEIKNYYDNVCAALTHNSVFVSCYHSSPLRSLWSWMTIWKSKRSEDERRRGWVKNSEKLVAHFAICIEELYEAQQRWRREDDDESDSSGWAERNEICLKKSSSFSCCCYCVFFVCAQSAVVCMKWISSSSVECKRKQHDTHSFTPLLSSRCLCHNQKSFTQATSAQ